MRLSMLLAFLALPAGYAPEELLTGRNDIFDCPTETGPCTVKRKDAEWLVGRDQLLNQLLSEAVKRYQRCGMRDI